MPSLTLADYLSIRYGLRSSTALYDLGLTREHAHAVWNGRERLTEFEIHLLNQVFFVPVEDLLWFNTHEDFTHAGAV
jgi:hypothetical protein